jgi:AcrR family transcriptional regulator
MYAKASMEPKSRKAEHADETRRALLDAARDLFLERGFHETSTEDIVHRARVTRGALYHHFKDKAELFIAVVDELDAAFWARIETGCAGVDGAMAKVCAVCNTFLDACLDPRARRVASVDPRSVVGEAAFAAQDRPVIRLLAPLLEQAQRDGAIGAHDPVLLARLIVGALHEASLAISRAGDPEATRDRAGYSIEAMLDGLKIAPGRS